jgi:radical SAM superfamily enzyme YgiQ (UPF0313 family)
MHVARREKRRSVVYRDAAYMLDTRKFKDFSFDIGPMGPPSEHGSLMLRVARNCPWNRCLFCTSYKGQKPSRRGVDEMKLDIDTVKLLKDEVEMASLEFGYARDTNGRPAVAEAVSAIIRGNPEIYGSSSTEDAIVDSRLRSLFAVAGWVANGCRTVFLQDADPLAIEQSELVEVLRYLKEIFPSTERVTAYARSSTINRKTVEDLEELNSAGLSRLHVGLESGCNEVLDFIKKGVTADEHIQSGKKVVESGISLCDYVMPGLGGKKWSAVHALESARVVSEISPDFIRIRSLTVVANSGLYKKWKAGEFEPLTEDEMVDELAVFIENLHCSSHVVSDQLTNILLEVEGQLPEEKGKMLGVINSYRDMPVMDRLRFRLFRYLNGGYYDCVKSWGKLDSQLERLVEEAEDSLERESPDAQSKVDQAILCLREKGIP